MKRSRTKKQALELFLKLRQYTDPANEPRYLGAWDSAKTPQNWRSERTCFHGKIHCIAYSAKQKLREEESRNSS